MPTTLGMAYSKCLPDPDSERNSSAIDNATRGLMQLGQLPVTCGLFFSLGHSTIVVIFIVAIAISTDIFDKAGGFGDVGGIIGEDFGDLIQYIG